MYHVQKNIKTLFLYYPNYLKRRKSSAHLRAKFRFSIFAKHKMSATFSLEVFFYLVL